MILGIQDRRDLAAIVREAHDASAVVLFGSAARPIPENARGDIDVLVLDSKIRSRLTGSLQVVSISSERLMHRLSVGDDFPQWVLRFGKVLAGREFWRTLQTEALSAAVWPKAELKFDKADERLGWSITMLEAGDLEAASEELRFAATHLARAKLLARGEFPLSRPELVIQLESVRDLPTAKLLREALSEAIHPSDRLHELQMELRAMLGSTADSAA